MRAEILEGGLESIRKEIRKGRPIIAFLNLGFSAYPIGHYIVVFGYDDVRKIIITHWGNHPNKYISYSRFLKAWEKTGEWVLLVLPP